MQILVVETGKAPETRDISGSLKEMQSIVGGYIQAIYPFPGIALVQRCINNRAIILLAIDLDLWQNGKKKQGGSSHAIRSGQRKFTR